MLDILQLSGIGERIIVSQGTTLCQTHSKVDFLYLLDEGNLAYYLSDEVTEEVTDLFSISRKGMVIGWEVLIPPERFISNVEVSSSTASLLKIKKEDFLAMMSPVLLRKICSEIQYLLEISFYKQTDLLSKKVKQRAIQLDNYFISQDSTLEERTLLLQGSPFFGEFNENQVVKLADLMERREYEANDLIYDQDENTKGIFVLIQGEVSMRRQEGEVYLNLRSISTPGYLFGWSCTFAETDICRASAEHKTSVYFISLKKLEPLIAVEEFGIDFYKMVVWLLGNQIQLSQSRYTYLLDDHNLVSVKHLIDTNRPRIPLHSPLHQIPHLLNDSTTQSLAFSTLHQMHKEGTKQERHLSSICLDLLKTEEREMHFMKSIEEVYTEVSTSNSEDSFENRRLCAEKTREVFRHLEVHIEGQHNLPVKSGNIFIYNHLLNHPLYTLNNLFQLTLDSHFISAMILDQHYDDPGIRTVRYGKSSEFGHQDYYDKLGYINVYTSESDLQNQESRHAAKEIFYKEAVNYLRNGENLIISPEGTSFVSEESPGPFKMGPFNIAERAITEPYIVPLILYNFDKRISENLLFCRILNPFRISEKMKESETLKNFVNRYQREFSKEVEKAGADTELLSNELTV
ncbi:MAG: cyclic nucleotide-binding domain-containing protein [Bacteroidota bacterium]